MTADEARARLERMVAPDMDPALATDDVDDLMVIAQIPDSCDRPPSDPDWIPTWDLDAAAAAGWEIKAGRAAGGFDFGEDGQRFNRSQIHTGCMAMVAVYRRGKSSTRVSSGAVEAYERAVARGLIPNGQAFPLEVIE